MAVNKVIFGGKTLIDLTGDTVTEDKLLSGFTTHDMTGNLISGTCTFDSDTSDATVKPAEVLIGSTYYSRGSKNTGTMPNNGGVNDDINSVDESFTIPQGYHDGSGKVKISDVEQAKIVPANIKQGVSILGITGTLEPSSEIKVQAKTVIPSVEKLTVLPDEGIDYLSQVIVDSIPYTETSNSAGGITVTIAG